MSLWSLPNTWLPVLHSLYPQVASTANGKLGAQKESRTRLNHSYRVLFKLNFQSFVVLAGLEIPSFLIIFWSFHSLPQMKPGSWKVRRLVWKEMSPSFFRLLSDFESKFCLRLEQKFRLLLILSARSMFAVASPKMILRCVSWRTFQIMKFEIPHNSISKMSA